MSKVKSRTDREMDDRVMQFSSVTGASSKDARRYLTKYKRLDQALDAYYNDPGAGARSTASSSKLGALFDKYKGAFPRPAMRGACSSDGCRARALCPPSDPLLPGPCRSRRGRHRGGRHDPAVRGPEREPGGRRPPRGRVRAQVARDGPVDAQGLDGRLEGARGRHDPGDEDVAGDAPPPDGGGHGLLPVRVQLHVRVLAAARAALARARHGARLLGAAHPARALRRRARARALGRARRGRGRGHGGGRCRRGGRGGGLEGGAHAVVVRVPREQRREGRQQGRVAHVCRVCADDRCEV
ncbi:hypothetical protein C8Q78DRAFT_702535 [Trametes maxima]|nr:hypothetical protein C8Q78DRAFT_702535 [Trametes maxima]